METIKVKPWSKDQGDFVIINKSDFDPEVHEPHEAKADEAKQGRAPRATKPAQEPHEAKA